MIKGFYFITDGRLSVSGNLSDIRNAVSAGVKIIQYRRTIETARQAFEECRIIRRLCKDALFIVNNRIDIAVSVCADGVHLGPNDLPVSAVRKLLGKNKLIGVSTNSLKEAQEAYNSGSDYISIGPIFPTKTKSDARTPVGPKLISEIKRHIPIPVVAIGGINISNAPYVVKAGADSLCAISDVVTRKNVKESIEKFQELF